MSLILRMPWPDSSLWPNRFSGKHWSTRHKAKVAAREAGFYAVKQAKGASLDLSGTIPVSIVFCAPSARRFDLDGALSALKPTLDGIAAGLGIDDSKFRPILIDGRGTGKPGCILIALGVRIETSQSLEIE